MSHSEVGLHTRVEYNLTPGSQEDKGKRRSWNIWLMRTTGFY